MCLIERGCARSDRDGVHWCFRRSGIGIRRSTHRRSRSPSEYLERGVLRAPPTSTAHVGGAMCRRSDGSTGGRSRTRAPARVSRDRSSGPPARFRLATSPTWKAPRISSHHRLLEHDDSAGNRDRTVPVSNSCSSSANTTTEQTAFSRARCRQTASSTAPTTSFERSAGNDERSVKRSATLPCVSSSANPQAAIATACTGSSEAPHDLSTTAPELVFWICHQ